MMTTIKKELLHTLLCNIVMVATIGLASVEDGVCRLES